MFSKISNKLNEKGKSIDLSSKAIHKEKKNSDPVLKIKINWSKKTIKILKAFIIENPKPYCHI